MHAWLNCAPIQTSGKRIRCSIIAGEELPERHQSPRWTVGANAKALCYYPAHGRNSTIAPRLFPFATGPTADHPARGQASGHPQRARGCRLLEWCDPRVCFAPACPRPGDWARKSLRVFRLKRTANRTRLECGSGNGSSRNVPKPFAADRFATARQKLRVFVFPSLNSRSTAQSGK